MAPENYIISQYPLTDEYLERFSERFGILPKPIILANIVDPGYLGILRNLRSIRAHTIYVPAQDSMSESMLPLLEILGLFIPARKRISVRHDFTVGDFGYFTGLKHLVGIGWNIVQGVGVLVKDWFSLRKLYRSKRIKISDNCGSQILYLKTNLWFGLHAGGAIAHTKGVISGLIKHGYRVDYASSEALYMNDDQEYFNFKPVRPPSTYVVPRELNHHRHSSGFISIASRWGVGKYRFIYQRFSLANLTGVILSRIFSIPLVLEYNGSELWLTDHWGRKLSFRTLAKWAEEICLRHAHLIVTVSDVLRNQLIERGIESERVIANPNGVSPELFNPDRFTVDQIESVKQKYGIPRNAYVVTFVGTFGFWHGAEVLAAAVRESYNSQFEWMHDNRFHFLFIGDGPKRKETEEILSIPGLESFCTLTGLTSQEKTPLLMAASDVFISPHVPNRDGTPFFGSPTKLFEYLSMGKPIIASRLDQITEIMEGSPHISQITKQTFEEWGAACGILVGSNKPKELLQALQCLVENLEWSRQAGLNAQARAKKNYTWEQNVGRTLNQLDAVLKQEIDKELPAFDRPVKVLFNALHSKSGGGITYLQNILPLLNAHPDIELHVCIHQEQEDLLPDQLDEARIHKFNFATGFWRLLIREQIDVPRLGNLIGADITFSPANYGPVFSKNPVILLRNALSVAFVEKRPLKFAYWILLYVVTLVSLKACRHAITVSNYAERSLGKTRFMDMKDHLTVVPHGIHIHYQAPEKGLKRKKFLLAVSDLYVQKNFKNLLLAIAALRIEYPAIHLKIAGSPLDPPYFASLKKLISQNGIEENVTFLGKQTPDQLLKLYQSCRIFVFPSSVETFGNPLVEAMACGAPIACSESAAMPEVIGDAAEYFDPFDVEDMVSAIRKLISDEELCEKLGERAIKRANFFSWEKTAEKTVNVFKRVMISKNI